MKRYLPAIIGVLVLGAVGLWLSQYLVYEEQQIDLGPSPAVRSNHYLAMEHFLQEQGIAVSSTLSLDALPALDNAYHTVIILGQAQPPVAQQSKQLLDWVAQGGHLVVSAEHEEINAQEPSSLLHSLGIKKQATAQLAPAHSEQVTQADSATLAAKNLTRLYLENEQSPAYLALDSRYHIHDSANRAHAWANSQETTQLLQLSHGLGLVTVLSELTLWNNKNIGAYDHAWLLWYLSQDTEVTLFNTPAQQSLLKRIWLYYSIACVLLLALLLLGAWSAAPRFAAIRQPIQSTRRRLTEHLLASALFNVRYKQQRQMLLTLQKDIKQRAQQRYPGFVKLAMTQQWAILQQLSRQPMNSISHSMRPPPTHPLSAHAFTQHVARLQHLRNAL